MRARSTHWVMALAAAGLMAGCATQGEVAEPGSDEIVVTGTASDGDSAEYPAPPPPPPPPAPPPPPVMRSDTGAVAGVAMEPAETRSMDTITVTGGEIAPEAKTEPDAIIMPPEPRPDQPEPQAGMLTAGDYDDVLNPDLYKAYLDKVLQGPLKSADLPYVDAHDRIAIKVVDRLGKPVPLAKVSLQAADGSPMFPLRTGADGMAYIYPAYDALSEGITVSISADGNTTLRRVISAERLGQGGVLEFDLSRDAAPASRLDLLLTLDATGSMSDEMRYLQVELVSILKRLKRNQEDLDIHVGLIVYRDKGDDYVVREVPFTGDFEAFMAEFSAQQAEGGGDFPEAMQDAMKAGLDFAWRDDAIKINMLVADAPPHDEDIQATWDSALISRSRGIHVVPIAASGVEKTAEFLMRGMAQLTGGRYMFLTDDSGIGNAHAEPTVDCYVVTRLDGLVLRVLESLVTGTRVEPDGDDVIRTVGNYRAGVCKLDDTQVG